MHKINSAWLRRPLIVVVAILVLVIGSACYLLARLARLADTIKPLLRDLVEFIEEIVEMVTRLW